MVVRSSIAGRPVLPAAREGTSAHKAARLARVNFREVRAPNTPHAPRREALPVRAHQEVREGVQGSGRVQDLGHLVQAAALVRVQVEVLAPVVVLLLRARLRDRRVDQERPGAAAASNIRKPRKAR